MTVVCVGTSHRKVPVESLESAIVAARRVAADWAAALANGAFDDYPWSELVLLATCNRVELYVAGDGDGALARDWLYAALATGPTIPGDRVWYDHVGEAAIRHLCRVSAGLDSMVLGEAQISGQVARAFRMGTSRMDGEGVLRVAARLARKVSRRARSETGISRGPASVSSLAVRMAIDEAGGLAGKRVLVVGAGKMSRLACNSLGLAVGEGTHVTVLNRTVERAISLAARLSGDVASLDALPALLVAADVVLASTASPEPLIDEALVRDVMAVRPARTLVLVDIAVPRNVESSVRTVAGVRLFGLEDLRVRLASQLRERALHVGTVEAIVEEVVQAPAGLTVS
ncbi:MAG: glutamyl-tRNA reductase [Longimicrobiales bacterium]